MFQLERNGEFWRESTESGGACWVRGDATLCCETQLVAPVLCKMEIWSTKGPAGSADLLLTTSLEEPMRFLALKAEILGVTGVSSCLNI